MNQVTIIIELFFDHFKQNLTAGSLQNTSFKDGKTNIMQVEIQIMGRKSALKFHERPLKYNHHF